MRIFSYTEETDGKALFVPVDLIRTFAIICVIMIHASIEYYGTMKLDYNGMILYVSTTSAYQAVAIVAVPFFAMLSGALLLRPSKANEPIRVFLKKRLSRLGLAWAFWTIIYFAWSYFVGGNPFSWSWLINGIFSSGAYYHFWFFYLIAGLYLATPVLRVVVFKGDTRILRYLLILWFAGVAVMPFLKLATGYSLNSNLFLFTGYIGYFIMGAFLQRVRAATSFLFLMLGVGLTWTLVGTWFMVFPFNWMGNYYFFYDTLSVNVILTAVSLYMLLSKAHVDWPGKAKHPHFHVFIHAVSVNTLPIFLFHVIILESLERGYFGFTLSLTQMNPIIEIPLATVTTLVITLGLILLMRRVPVLSKLIGSASL